MCEQSDFSQALTVHDLSQLANEESYVKGIVNKYN